MTESYPSTVNIAQWLSKKNTLHGQYCRNGRCQNRLGGHLLENDSKNYIKGGGQHHRNVVTGMVGQPESDYTVLGFLSLLGISAAGCALGAGAHTLLRYSFVLFTISSLLSSFSILSSNRESMGTVIQFE